MCSSLASYINHVGSRLNTSVREVSGAKCSSHKIIAFTVMTQQGPTQSSSKFDFFLGIPSSVLPLLTRNDNGVAWLVYRLSLDLYFDAFGCSIVSELMRIFIYFLFISFYCFHPIVTLKIFFQCFPVNSFLVTKIPFSVFFVFYFSVCSRKVILSLFTSWYRFVLF